MRATLCSPACWVNSMMAPSSVAEASSSHYPEPLKNIDRRLNVATSPSGDDLVRAGIEAVPFGCRDGKTGPGRIGDAGCYPRRKVLEGGT